MIQNLQTPAILEPINPSEENDRLDYAVVKTLIRAQQSRIRQRLYRARLSAKKQNDNIPDVLSTVQVQTERQQVNDNDILAQAINLSNILIEEENDALDEILAGQVLDRDDNEALDE